MYGHLTAREKIAAFIAGILVGGIALVLVLTQVPGLRERVGWRIEIARVYLRGIISPSGALPTAAATIVLPTETRTVQPTFTAVPHSTGTPPPLPTSTPTLLPPPPEARLLAPAYEEQDINNCGPVALSMYLRFWGWQGDQFTIANEVKPVRQDRNVNVEELVAFVNTRAAWLEVQYRVGGDLDTLKRIIASGQPVMIEAAMYIEETFWPDDDHWAGHYLLLTGYDDAKGIFITQDSFRGPNVEVRYEQLEKDWKAFNRVYVVIYPPDQRAVIQEILGPQWGVMANRQHALDLSQAEVDADPTDSYAWFNLGSNLVYFEKYSQAAIAYDQARAAGLPQRMLRYQFGPFFAYFNTGRMDDLLALTDYALQITPNSEEAMLWRGWAMYRQGDKVAAAQLYEEALGAHPGYTDALYALDFLRQN